MRIWLGITAIFVILFIAEGMDKKLLSKDVNWTSDIYLIAGVIITKILDICLCL